MTSKPKLKKSVFYICLAVFVLVLVYIVSMQLNSQNRQQASLKLAEEVRIEPPIQEYAPEEIPLEEEVEEDIPELTVEIPIDFIALQEINPDIHAWIYIPGSPIDYPILQSVDDQEFYLDHNIYRQACVAGAIFTQDFNGLNFEDVHTIIYGHNMADGSKFSALHQYLDASFMDEHDIIYIYTPQNILRYQVVYAVTYDNRHILMSFDFTEDDEYELFIYSLRNAPNVNNQWNPNVNWRVGEPFITLSTCTDDTFLRLLIGAILIEKL